MFFIKLKKFLKSSFHNIWFFSDETSVQQDKLIRKLIQRCMTYLLSTPEPTLNALSPPQVGLFDLIDAYADTSWLLSYKIHS